MAYGLYQTPSPRRARDQPSPPAATPTRAQVEAQGGRDPRRRPPRPRRLPCRPTLEAATPSKKKRRKKRQQAEAPAPAARMGRESYDAYPAEILTLEDIPGRPESAGLRLDGSALRSPFLNAPGLLAPGLARRLRLAAGDREFRQVRDLEAAFITSREVGAGGGRGPDGVPGAVGKQGRRRQAAEGRVVRAAIQGGDAPRVVIRGFAVLCLCALSWRSRGAVGGVWALFRSGSG